MEDHNATARSATATTKAMLLRHASRVFFVFKAFISLLMRLLLLLPRLGVFVASLLVAVSPREVVIAADIFGVDDVDSGSIEGRDDLAGTFFFTAAINHPLDQMIVIVSMIVLVLLL